VKKYGGFSGMADILTNDIITNYNIFTHQSSANAAAFDQFVNLKGTMPADNRTIPENKRTIFCTNCEL
jgi:hypothetical protein